MPNCTICGKPIDKLPNWLDDVEITFRCAVCAESTSHTPPPADDDDAEETTSKSNEEDEKEEESEEEDEESED
jgi:ribosomal protein L12E/L44/L45/RPP1/RPP2